MIKKQKINHIIANRSIIDIDSISTLYTNYPDNFVNWCQSNKVNPPQINTANGFALACMLHNSKCYFKSEECDKIMEKFGFLYKALL